MKWNDIQDVPGSSLIAAPTSDGRAQTTPGERLPIDEESDDPLSHAQVLSSIRAAKQRKLPTGDVLRAVRRQIDVD